MSKILGVLCVLFLLTSLWLTYLLTLAESDAAYWRSQTKPTMDNNVTCEEDRRILQIAIQNFCKPLEVKKFKLGNPVRGR